AARRFPSCASTSSSSRRHTDRPKDAYGVRAILPRPEGRGLPRTGSNTLAQTVVSRLRAAILAGEYLPGSRLTELGLAEDMQTSRTPVIAALKALTEQGLVR